MLKKYRSSARRAALSSSAAATAAATSASVTTTPTPAASSSFPGSRSRSPTVLRYLKAPSIWGTLLILSAMT